MAPTKDSRWLKILFGNLFPDVCFLLQCWSMWYIVITVLEYVIYIYYNAGVCDIYIYYSAGVCNIYLLQCWSMWYIYLLQCWSMWYIFITVLEYVRLVGWTHPLLSQLVQGKKYTLTICLLILHLNFIKALDIYWK